MSQVEARLPDVRGLNCLPISALTGEGTQQLLPAAVTLYQAWTRRIPTARLNRWLVAVSPRSAAVLCVHLCTLRTNMGSCSWAGKGVSIILYAAWVTGMFQLASLLPRSAVTRFIGPTFQTGRQLVVLLCQSQPLWDSWV